MAHSPSEHRMLVDPAVMFGKPVIRGTRMPVSLIVELIEAGATPAEIVSDYPELTKEDIVAALLHRSGSTNRSGTHVDHPQ